MDVPSEETEPANSRVALPLIEAVTPVPTAGAPVVGAIRSVPSITETELLSPSEIPPARLIVPPKVIGPEPVAVRATACPPSPILPLNVSELVELLAQVCEA